MMRNIVQFATILPSASYKNYKKPGIHNRFIVAMEANVTC